MYKAMQRRIREGQDQGFTLIELLIVIVILGVLAGIVVFAVSGINDQSNVSACKSDYKNVEIASEAYYANATPHAYAPSIAALVTAGFLREAPSNTNYTITYDGPPTGKVHASGACTIN